MCPEERGEKSTYLPRYQSIEVNSYICSPGALNMGALNL